MVCIDLRYEIMIIKCKWLYKINVSNLYSLIMFVNKKNVEYFKLVIVFLK